MSIGFRDKDIGKAWQDLDKFKLSDGSEFVMKWVVD